MGKSCGQHKIFSLGGQYYSLGHPSVYRTRAINHRGFYSKITILALKLPHKKRIKIAF